FCLKKKGLIESDEVRLPLTAISDELKEETFEEKKKRELEAYALELEAEAKGEISLALEKHEGA
ncbi:hypothetical protein, partial [Clostridium neonatale]|uniref:hypothetical protein n=1 Tax=Clostridium neonatale TaxID=137838 RepID=UPI0029374757